MAEKLVIEFVMLRGQGRDSRFWSPLGPGEVVGGKGSREIPLLWVY